VPGRLPYIPPVQRPPLELRTHHVSVGKQQSVPDSANPKEEKESACPNRIRLWFTRRSYNVKENRAPLKVLQGPSGTRHAPGHPYYDLGVSEVGRLRAIFWGAFLHKEVESKFTGVSARTKRPKGRLKVH
jgi:hypothetical protein